MLLSLATPYYIQILIGLLPIVPPEDQINVIKILHGLHQNKLPTEIFDTAAKPLLTDKIKEQELP
jgi:hypothetical protein